MPASSSLYQPTAEEEAYGLYIFQKLFGKLPGADGSIHSKTKTALEILEKSGVDKIILRTIVNVAVDPENRELTNMGQFHVVLRLIALAQDGLLEQELNRAFQQERNQTTPVAVFQKTLWMSSGYTDCPLPSFDGIPIPTEEFIRNLSNKIKGTPVSLSPAPSPKPIRNAPAPSPPPKAPAPSPFRAPSRQKSSPELPKNPTKNQRISPTKKPPIDEITVKRGKSSQTATGCDTPYLQGPDSSLDLDNFELLQEQAALERVISESKPSQGISKPEKKAASTHRHKDVLSEEQALQKAIYESTHEAASPPRPASVPVAAAAAPKSDEHRNWLRMDSLVSLFLAVATIAGCSDRVLHLALHCTYLAVFVWRLVNRRE